MSEISRSELGLLYLRKMAQKHVRPMSAKDIPAVVEIHVAAFPGYFMTSLGPKFLALFYAEAQRSSSCVAQVFERDGMVRGFCLGELNSGSFYRRLFVRNWFLLTVISLMAVVKQPWILVRIARSLLERSARSGPEDYSVLGSTAVFPEEEARGYGLALVTAYLDHLRKLGVREVRCEVSIKNQGLIRAYRTMGFQVLGERRVFPGTTLVELSCHLRNEEAGA